MGPMQRSLAYLVQTAFEMYILVVALRILLQWVRADFYNPLSQFIVKVTNPVVVPLRRIIPGIGGLDWASLLLLVVLTIAEITLLRSILQRPLSGEILILLTIGAVITEFWYILIISLSIQVIVSWVNPGGYNPALSLVYSINQPILQPFQKMIPPISGLDISPIFVFIAFQLFNMLIIEGVIGYHRII